MTKFEILFCATLTILVSCKQEAKKNVDKKPTLYFLSRSRYNVDTISIDKPRVPDSTFQNIVTKHFSTPLGDFTIEKFSNEPSADTDGGIEMFYEKAVGVFYSRSLTWPTYQRLYSNCDSINIKLNLLVDHVISEPELVNFPAQPEEKNKHRPVTMIDY